MSSPQVMSFTLTAGEDRTLQMRARTRTGGTLDLTDATMTWRLARSAADSAVLEKTPDITSAIDGEFSVALPNDDTEELSGLYVHQAIATIAGETTVCTTGVIRVDAMVGQIEQNTVTTAGGDPITA